MPRDAEILRATLLGTGTSTGVPVIGCSCRVCTSTDPRDRRTRCSSFIEAGGVSILVDVGPDFRHQALREQIDHVDAVFFTHHHFDHVAGIDDLRPFLFRNRSPIPCYALPEIAASLRGRFDYIFENRTYLGVPDLRLAEIEGRFSVASRENPDVRVEATTIEGWHGNLRVAGLRIGGFAYLTDVSRIPESEYERLRDLDVLVLDALRHESHPTHFSISEATEQAGLIGARQTVLVHMTHTVLHAEDDARLEGTVSLGFDGMQLEARL